LRNIFVLKYCSEHNHWKLLKQEGTIENRNIIQIVYETEGHLAVYGQVCHPENIIWTSASFRSINILGVTDRSINCHLAQSAMNYLLYYTQPTKTTSIRTQLGALYGLSRFYILLDLARSNILYIGPACLQRQIV
jgi:hypothetical protein